MLFQQSHLRRKSQAGGGLAGKGPNSDAEPVMGTLGEGGVGRRVSELGVYVRNGGVPCIFKRSTILQTAGTTKKRLRLHFVVDVTVSPHYWYLFNYTYLKFLEFGS